MTETLQELLDALARVLDEERGAIAKLDLASLESLTNTKATLTASLEEALVQPELRDDPTRRRDVARAVAKVRRQAAINAILLQDAQTMVSRVRPQPKVQLTYTPRACNVRARAANDGQVLAMTGAHD